MHIDELIAMIDAAERPTPMIDRLVAERLGGSSATRYSGEWRAARSAVPDGWGVLLEDFPWRPCYCEAHAPAAQGHVRVGATAATPELALLSAALRAQKHVRGHTKVGAAHGA